MEYLDQPQFDGSPKAHPAFWRGKAIGINAVLEIVSNIMMGEDDGSGTNNHTGIEQMRQGLIQWRAEVNNSFVSKNESKVDKKEKVDKQ